MNQFITELTQITHFAKMFYIIIQLDKNKTWCISNLESNRQSKKTICSWRFKLIELKIKVSKNATRNQKLLVGFYSKHNTFFFYSKHNFLIKYYNFVKKTNRKLKKTIY